MAVAFRAAFDVPRALPRAELEVRALGAVELSVDAKPLAPLGALPSPEDVRAVRRFALPGPIAPGPHRLEVRVTASGETMDVVVVRKRPERIEVVLGTGAHSVTCELTPTRTGKAYAGKVMGREIVYERSRDEVQADLDRAHPGARRSRPR